MTDHLPECPCYLALRENVCICDRLRTAYRRGYDDARGITDNGDGTITVYLKTYGNPFNQHGTGTNP